MHKLLTEKLPKSLIHSNTSDSQPSISLSSNLSNLDLPPVLQSLPTGVSQMANDALSRLQAQQKRNDEKMEVDN